MRAMLLCAGLGVRLRPLTNFLPKPLLPIFGRPAADFMLEALAEAGVSDVVVNIHHLPDAVTSAFGSRARGMNIHYSHEPELLGPTGGIRKALPLLGEAPFIVVNGDALMDIDFRAMMSAHKTSGAALTIAVGPGEDVPRLRAVGVDSEGRVRSLWGKPERPGEQLYGKVNIGAFIYEPRIVAQYIPDNSFYHFREGFMPELFEREENIRAFETPTYWNDIGSAESYLRAWLDAFSGGGTERMRAAAARGAEESMQRVSRREGAEDVRTSNPNAEIKKTSLPFKIVEPIYIETGVAIGEGAVVGPNVALCANSSVGAGAKLSDTLVMPGAAVAPNAIHRRSIILPSQTLQV